MKLKEKILEILLNKNTTYEVLASHLGFSEKDLDFALENNTVEIRTLELISKELRIPLYSFFREIAEPLSEKESFYNVNIWSTEEFRLKREINVLKQEIENLKMDLRQNDLLIQALEEQVQKSDKR